MWMSGAFLKLKRAMPSSFGVPLRPADAPHIPIPHVQPAHHIFHPFSRHFYIFTFSWPLARAWCIDPQCAPSHTQLKVWQSSVHTPMHWICRYAHKLTCRYTHKLTWSLNFYKGVPKCNKIVILPDFYNQTSYLTSEIFFELQNLNLNQELASAEIFFLFCCCFHCVWMSKSENLQRILVWQLCCNRADFRGWSMTVQTHHSQTPCSRSYHYYHHLWHYKVNRNHLSISNISSD